MDNTEAREHEEVRNGPGNDPALSKDHKVPLDDAMLETFKDMKAESEAIDNTLEAAAQAHTRQKMKLRVRRNEFWRACAVAMGVNPDDVENGKVGLRLDLEDPDGPHIRFHTEDDE